VSLELFNTLATFGTFLVIAATAVAALFQLRHMRSANLIEAYNEVQVTFQSDAFREGQHFVLTELPERWHDPAFRYQLITPTARTAEGQTLIGKINAVGNFWEQCGLLLKLGLLDRNMILDTYWGNAVSAWERLLPVTAAFRRSSGDAIWENFEYFVVLAKDWEASHPDGNYPPGVRRIPVPDDLREADEQYAASLK